MLRGFRKAIRAAFEISKLGKGKHHWTEKKWIEKAETFLTDVLKFKSVTRFEVAATVLLLYHSFGPSELKKANQFFLDILGDEGIKYFKLIFDNNNKDLVKNFFEDKFVCRLWKAVQRYYTKEIVFGKNDPHPEINTTFRKITQIIETDFNLEMPQWWCKMFPALK